MKKFAMIGCGGIAILMMVFVAAISVWLFRELPVLSASISAPSMVQLDSELTLVVTATNPHQKAIVLDSIDIADSFLEGFQIVDVEPKPTSTGQIIGMRTWAFGFPVEPGASREISFKMKAVQEGHFSGDVDVCNPTQDFTTVIADVVVRPASGDE